MPVTIAGVFFEAEYADRKNCSARIAAHKPILD